MEIDRDAPVTAEVSLEIPTEPEVVWDVVADIEQWPVWNPDVREASIAGPVAVGTEFRWKAGPGTITSRLQLVARPHLIAWTGKTMGIAAVHVWRFEPVDGGTIATSAESWNGLLPRVLRRAMRRQLQKGLAGNLQHLKAEAQNRKSGVSL